MRHGSALQVTGLFSPPPALAPGQRPGRGSSEGPLPRGVGRRDPASPGAQVPPSPRGSPWLRWGHTQAAGPGGAGARSWRSGPSGCELNKFRALLSTPGGPDQWVGAVGGWAGAAPLFAFLPELFNFRDLSLYLFTNEGLMAPSPTGPADPPNKDISGFFGGEEKALGRSREEGQPRGHQGRSVASPTGRARGDPPLSRGEGVGAVNRPLPTSLPTGSVHPGSENLSLACWGPGNPMPRRGALTR